MRRACVGLLLALACASAPDAPAPGTSAVWGELSLVPREGVTPGGGGGSYGDRRLRDVEFVDYSRPGFAVVYVREKRPPAGRLELAIRDTRFGVRIEPAQAAIGAAGRVAIVNQGASRHVVSYPAAGVVREIAPGQVLELAVPQVGEQGVFLLDATAAARVFAAPGPFAVVSPSGRFTLDDLAPGRRELHAWHPRFPPARQLVELAANARVRVDLQLGVGVSGGGAHGH